jgi:hypothetical protein
MAVLSKLYRLPLFLAALCCVVAVALAVQWYYGSKNEQQTRKQLKKPVESTIALAEPPEDNLLLEDQGKFEEIMTRPLFIKSRKPLPEKKGGDIVETTAPQPMTELAAKFSGFIEVPGGKIALIKDIKTRKYHRLRKGEQVNDWTLTELYPDKVVFEQGDAVEELLLRTPKSRPGSGKTGRPHTAMRQPTAPVRNQSKPTASDRRQHLMKRIDRGKPRTPNPGDASGW